MSRLVTMVSSICLIMPVLFTMALPAESAPILATVTAVADGNTITVKCQEGKTEHVLLYGIDAPEVGQLYENISTRALSIMVYSKQITVDEVGRDRWNSIIGYVKLGDQDINAIMVEKGHAWANNEKYKSLQEKAQTVMAGLWGYHGKQVAPWEWIKKGQPDETFERVPTKRYKAPSSAVGAYYIVTIGNSRYVTGTVKNIQKKTYMWVRVSFDLCNSAGDILARTDDEINDLAPNASWAYKAVITDAETAQIKGPNVTYGCLRLSMSERMGGRENVWDAITREKYLEDEETSRRIKNQRLQR